MIITCKDLNIVKCTECFFSQENYCEIQQFCTEFGKYPKSNCSFKKWLYLIYNNLYKRKELNAIFYFKKAVELYAPEYINQIEKWGLLL